ncbi:MAG: hypothetical protein ACJAUV_001785 [Flavobacteriales bacterium]|jgi:hypothetical protein
MKLCCSFSLVFSFFIIQANAQNYQTVNADRIAYFADTYKDVSALRIDSVLSQDGMHLFPFKTIEAMKGGGYCVSPYVSSWIGKEVIMLNDGVNQFVNVDDEIISINTWAKLQDTWVAYVASTDSSKVMATIASHDNLSFLGITDSVKTITFQAYDKNDAPINSSVNYTSMQLSKNNGLVQTLNFHYFPDFAAGYPFLGFSELTLVGSNDIEQGVSNFTWFEANDFDVDDELHVVEYEQSENQSVEKNEIRTYLTRTDFADSIIYQYAREVQTEIDSLLPDNSVSTTIKYLQDTVTETIKRNPDFNKLPKETFYNGFAVNFYGMSFDESFVYKSIPKPNWETYQLNSEDSCWETTLWDGCVEMGNYMKTLGGPYFVCDENFTDKWSRQLVFYKKDTTTWGDPLDLTAIHENDANSIEFNLYPNPAADKIYWNINTNDLTNTFVAFYNVVGDLVKEIRVTNNMQTMDVSQLPKGIYVYKLKQDQEVLKSGKLVIQ